jgi:hypothetical protein
MPHQEREKNHAVEMVRAEFSRRSNEELVFVWTASESRPMSEELAMVRGWLLDELASRMDELDARDAAGIPDGSSAASLPPEGRFDRWLFAEAEEAGEHVSPAAYLT